MRRGSPWTDADVSTVLRLVTLGQTGEQIGEQIGRTRTSVIALLARLRNEGDSRIAAAEAARAAARAGGRDRGGRPRDDDPRKAQRREIERQRYWKRKAASPTRVEASVQVGGVRSVLPEAPCFLCGDRGWCRHRSAAA